MSSTLAVAEGYSCAQPVLVKKVIADRDTTSVLGSGSPRPGGVHRRARGHAEAGPGQGPIIQVDARTQDSTETTTK